MIPTFYISSFLFAATFLLGILVQFRVVDSSGFRWLHHVLFFVVFATTALSCTWGVFAGEGYGIALIPVLVLYFILPRIRAGTFGHAAIAVSALLFYAMGFVLISG